MTTRIRKQIYIDPYQEVVLKRLVDTTGVPEAAIIRQAIDQHIRYASIRRPDRQAWQQERSFILDRIAQTTETSQASWTREDLYER